MVAIDAGIPLLTVPGGAEMYGISNSKYSETFVMTSSKSVSVFKVPGSKPLQTWLNKPSSSFSCAAVHCAEPDQFAAVANEKQLWRWSMQDLEPFKQKPKALKQGVARMFSCDGGGGQPLVLMSNGSLRWLGDVLGSGSGGGGGGGRHGCLEGGEAIRDAWVWQRGSSEGPSSSASSMPSLSYVVCLLQNVKAKDYQLVIQRVPRENADLAESSGDDVIRLQLSPPHEGDSLQSVSFSSSPASAVLYTLWSGGKLCKSVIEESSLRKHRDTRQLPFLHQLTLLGNVKQLKIAAVDDRHVAVAGPQQRSAKDKLEAALSIWETNFGTQQAFHSLTCEEGDDGIPLYLAEVKGHLLLATKKGVKLHRYECSTGTLVCALGRLASVEVDQELPSIGLSWGSTEEPEVKKSKGRKSKSKVIAEPQKFDAESSSLLQNILDMNETKTSKAFSSAVEKYLETHPDSTALTSILRNMVRRVEDNPKFWCGETAHDLITTKLIAASACPEFVALLARRKEVGLLMDCLQCMKDIPELTLVQCLQAFLSMDEGKQTAETPMEADEDATQVDQILSPTQRTYVDEVLAKPFTDGFLLDAVKHLQFKDVLSLLTYLHHLLTAPHRGPEDTPPSVTMDNVVDWTSVLLDAHFAQLVLIPEVRPLLSSLKDAVKQQVDFSADLRVIRDLLHHAQSSKTRLNTRTASAAQSYAIEVLKI